MGDSVLKAAVVVPETAAVVTAVVEVRVVAVVAAVPVTVIVTVAAEWEAAGGCKAIWRNE